MVTSDDIQAALDDARRLAAEGAYEQALERHVWYHQNALIYAPAHYGVRLSFALALWADLGKVYPDALLKLQEARDHALATFRKVPSDSLMYAEIMSLNLALDDWPACKQLFYEGASHDVVDSSLASEVDQIIELGDIEWAKDVVGDPSDRLKEIQQMWELTRIASGSEGIDEMSARQIVKLVKAVAALHGVETAQRIQADALRFLDSPEVRDALIAS